MTYPDDDDHETHEEYLDRQEEHEREMDERHCDEWNRNNPPGTPVWLTDDHGQRHETVTRSIAWVLPNGIPLVMVEGRTGGYMLERIEVRR